MLSIIEISERALLVVGVTRLALLQRTLFVVYQTVQRSCSTKLFCKLDNHE